MSTFLTCQVKRISVEAGLPNITASVNGAMVNQGTFINATSASYLETGPYTWGIGLASGQRGFESYERLNLDASRSNPIYDNSNMVVPLSQSTLYVVKY